MKEFPNKDLDLMLRVLGRQQRNVPVSSDQHLDADELNAYAEGVLPPGTREHYTSHLADCGVCRNLVTQLSLAAGVKPVKAPAQTEQKSFWEQIALLFSPRGVRYAVPALALFAVLVVSIVALRQGRDSNLVALRPSSGELEAPMAEPTVRTPEDPAQNAAKDSHEGINEGLLATSPAKSPARIESSRAKEEAQSSSAKSQKDEQPPPSPAAVPSYAPEPQATVVAKPSAPSDRSEDLVKKVELPRTAREAEFDAAGEEKEKARQGATRSESQVAGRSVRGAREVGRARTTQDEAQARETRTVAGTEFRRQRNVWIDVSYKSSLPLVNLRRNTEQFRALVADEPRIRTITTLLEGEVIVVAKEKAYHIR